MKYLVTVLVGVLLIPSISFAATPQELYVSALQQVIVLLRQQVEVLVAQLSQLNDNQNKIVTALGSATPETILPAYTPVIINPPTMPETPKFGSAAVPPKYDIRLTIENQTSSISKKELPRIEVNVYDENEKYIKKTVDVTTNYPDLPPSFTLNAPGQVYWFCVAPTYEGFPNRGCANSAPKTTGVFDFTFTVEDVSKSVQVTVTD